MLITEHSVRESLSVTDRSYIIHEGTVLFHGPAEQLVTNQEVRRLYLGETFYMDPEAHVRKRLVGAAASTDGENGDSRQ